ncbi:hypothetical protein [Streptomyces sp. NPDC020951]
MRWFARPDSCACPSSPVRVLNGKTLSFMDDAEFRDPASGA